MWDDEHARQQVVRAEELLSGLETLPDSAAAARAVETVEALVDLYGDCLARVMEHLGRDEEGAAAVRRLADDELVGHLLLVHDLHPDPVETRVRRAIEEVRPDLTGNGGDLELLEVSDTAVRIRVTEGRGCSSSAGAVEETVRDAVAAAAPEAERVDIETAKAPAPETLIPVDALFRSPALTGRGTG